MNTREEFERWVKERYLFDYKMFIKTLADEYDDYRVAFLWTVWQHQQAKITALTEENRRLKDSRENTVKMLQSVMQILDRVALK